MFAPKPGKSDFMNPIELSIFSSRMAAICGEMGACLRQAAFSPNIRDRLDFSCAVFDVDGELCAQAAHIPVHLGSMAFAMRGIVGQASWNPGDILILNDPYQGGTHLPDITVISPLFVNGVLVGFVANRAHHADIGAHTPGSMPVSKSLDEEGLLISPTLLYRAGHLDKTEWVRLLDSTRSPRQAAGDFNAQIAANRRGLQRLQHLVEQTGVAVYRSALAELNDYGERLARSTLRGIPDGRYSFQDVMDDDGAGNTDIPIKVTINCRDGLIDADFDGTASQVGGNVNCPVSVTAAAVFYVFRCLMPVYTPDCAGVFRCIRLSAPAGSVVNAQYPAAVAAGNVETSTRIVDVMIGALEQALPGRMPAASHGSMNNIAMGGFNAGSAWDYYETIGGGMGAAATHSGLSAVQTHMTNTLNSPIEALEMQYPLRVSEYAIRNGSGGAGENCGGNGIIREYTFLENACATLLTERRCHRPWGVAGGQPGLSGCNSLNGKLLPGKIFLELKAGDRLKIESAGGGGYGRPLKLEHGVHKKA